MKIKLEVELDTIEDQQVGNELVELLTLFKERLEHLNDEILEDD